MIQRKKLMIGVLIIAIVAVAGFAIAKKNRKEMVNGYFVYEFDGETTEEPFIPENAVEDEDVPDDIELQDDEIYLGTEENTETEEEKQRILDSIKDANKTSAAEVDKEEKELGLKGKVSYYYYSKLTSDQKPIYRSILKGLLNHDEKFYVGTDRVHVNFYFQKVMSDHPELFWADNWYSYWDYGDYVYVSPYYNRSKEQMNADKKKLNDAVNKIVKAASKEKSTYDKVLYVFKHLIEKTNYKLDVKDNQNAYSVLVNKISVCAGYARATQLLLQKMGIQCIYVHGDAHGGSHAWNILRLDKKYYQMDTTWGDPDGHTGSKEYLKTMPKKLHYFYEYFCTDDKAMLKGRKQDNSLGAPSCTSNDKSFYIHNHRYYDKYDDKVKKSIRKNIKEGKNFWHGQMANKKAFDALIKAFKNGFYSQSLYDIRGISKTTHINYNDEQLIIKLYY